MEWSPMCPGLIQHCGRGMTSSFNKIIRLYTYQRLWHGRFIEDRNWNYLKACNPCSCFRSNKNDSVIFEDSEKHFENMKNENQESRNVRKSKVRMSRHFVAYKADLWNSPPKM